MCLCNPIPVYKDGEGIKVYKVVEKVPYDNAYRSPYYPFGEGSLWKLGETNTIEECDPKFITMFDGTLKIEWGVFHTFYHLKDAAEMMFDWQKHVYACHDYTQYAVIECVIPANTKCAFFGWFYKNDSDDPVPSYASQSLTPVRVLTKEEINKHVPNHR